MADSYVIDNGGEGKEVPVPKRVNPIDALVAKADALRGTEKPKDEVVAGDETTKAYKASFAGKEEGVVPELEKDLIYGHCNNCRLELTEEKVTKQPTEYVKNEDGSFGKTATRFSIFCKNCMKFITLVDQDAAKMLQDMIKKVR